MEAVDPVSGCALPGDAIQRVLFVASPVHVYSILPLASMRGHSASSWTADLARHIFTARLRVLETALADAAPGAGLSVAVVLEDPADGQLFAAVEPAVDSSRFFALTVRDPAGRRAILGIGFEDRSDAFDFSVALQQARRSLSWDADQQHGLGVARAKESAKDYSLKDGETITINLADAKFGRRRPQEQQLLQQEETTASDSQSFALPPPPSSSASTGAGFPLPPPPSADDVKRKRRSLRYLGFDDGQFGEFA